MSKQATQILNKLVAQGLIKKEKPAAEKKKFKGFNKNKPKGKFGKPSNQGAHKHPEKQVRQQQKPVGTNNNSTGNGRTNNGDTKSDANVSKKRFNKKQFGNTQRPAQPKNQQNKQNPKTRNGQGKNKKKKKVDEMVVTGKVARLLITKDGLKLSNYTERPLTTAKVVRMRTTKSGRAIRPTDSSANYPDVPVAPFEPRGTSDHFLDPIRSEVREELTALQMLELPGKSVDTDDYVPTEEHDDHGEHQEVYMSIKRRVQEAA